VLRRLKEVEPGGRKTSHSESVKSWYSPNQDQNGMSLVWRRLGVCLIARVRPGPFFPSVLEKPHSRVPRQTCPTGLGNKNRKYKLLVTSPCFGPRFFFVDSQQHRSADLQHQDIPSLIL